MLIGSAAWASRRLPCGLSALYLVAGAASLFVYLLPGLEMTAGTLAVAASIWQGIVLWRAGPGEKPPPETRAGQRDRA